MIINFAQRPDCETQSVVAPAYCARTKELSEFGNPSAQLNLNLPDHLEQDPQTLLPPEPPEDAPDALKAAWPLVRMWAGSDATARGESWTLQPTMNWKRSWGWLTAYSR